MQPKTINPIIPKMTITADHIASPRPLPNTSIRIANNPINIKVDFMFTPSLL